MAVLLNDASSLDEWLSERLKEERHKLLIQQNPKGTKVTYIAYIGMINGIHYWKVGSSDDEHQRLYGKLMKARYDPAEKFSVDFDELYVHAGYARKQTAEEKLLGHFVEISERGEEVISQTLRQGRGFFPL